MSKFFRSAQSHRGRVPGAHASERHYSHGSKSILVCSQCHCYFYKKVWHHPAVTTRWGLRSELPNTKEVVCPACHMVQARQYTGRVLIENVPQRMLSELSNLIYSYGRKSFLRDPQDRLVDIKQRGSQLEITTTDNQLAVRLAKKIRDVFTKVTLAISHSEEPYLAQQARLRFV